MSLDIFSSIIHIFEYTSSLPLNNNAPVKTSPSGCGYFPVCICTKFNHFSIWVRVAILFPSLESFAKFWKPINAIVASIAKIVITMISSTSVKPLVNITTLPF